MTGNRAILIAIEHTGASKGIRGSSTAPFDGSKGIVTDVLLKRLELVTGEFSNRGLARDVRTLLRDQIVETVGMEYYRRLFRRPRYEKEVILVDDACTKENIRKKMVELGRDYAALDLAILGHGCEHPKGSGQCVLVLFGGAEGWQTNPANLRESDVRKWKKEAEFQNLNLHLVYMMNCYGSKFSDAWLELGFSTSIGSADVNWIPEPMCTLFWAFFMDGNPAAVAADKAWQISAALWQFVYNQDRRNAARPIVAGNGDLKLVP